MLRLPLISRELQRCTIAFSSAVVLASTACSSSPTGSADPAPVASVVVTLTALSVQAGQSVTATADLRDAKNVHLSNRTVEWSSSNTTVATISATGVVSTLTPGTTSITATSEGKTGSTTLTVTVPVASITFATNSTDIPIRATVTPVATARDAGGQPLTNRTITWQTSNAAVATVSNAGAVRMLLPGTATITATCEGHSATLQVNGTVAQLSALVDSMRLAKGVPAMGVIVVTREGVAAIGVGGNRRASGGPPVTIDDQWHIGSDLKAITAMLAGMAVDAQVLTWTKSMEQAFPDLLATMRAEYKPVTLRDLLSHQSGMINTTTGLPTGTTNLPTVRTTWIQYTVEQVPNNARGVYYYSNNGYGTAGAMIERAWGGSYEALMNSKLLAPLGITAYGWGATTVSGGTDQPVGHTLSGNTWVPCEACDNPIGASPAGTMHLSLTAWGRIIQELMLADQGRSSLLTQATARTLTTQAVPAGSSVPYAMGWIVTNANAGSRLITHDGSNNSNHSRATVALDTGVAFLININAADPAGGKTADALGAMNTRLNSYWLTGK